MRRGLRLLLPVLLLPLAVWLALPVISAGQSSEQLQRKIERTQGKIGTKKGTEKVLTTDISRFSGRIARLERRIGSLQSRENRVQADLDSQRARLDRTQTALREERARLTRLRGRLAEARQILSRRLVEIYQADAPDLVTVVLNAKGFADLLERQEFLSRINTQDQRVVGTVRSARADAKATSTRLAALERDQAAATRAVQARRDEIGSLRLNVVAVRSDVADLRAGKQQTLSGVRADRRQLEGSLSSLKAQQAKIQAALTASAAGLPAGAIRQGSGSMIWPVNGPITSPFCERRAWESCHPGIDIGVAAGTPIRVAASGKVALMQSVGASGGYGNFTCVQHSASLSTCYAHQSRFATSLGASVRQGDVIGYVGCTGLCFGDHLHFEVRVNGSVVNPMGYL